MNLFGKKKQAPPPNPAEAIMKLRGTMETLQKRYVWRPPNVLYKAPVLYLT
jgi:hypothetical protein